jgi:hypothetical protein
LLTDEELHEQNLLFAFGPLIEPYITENCFLPKDPVLMAREAWGNDIDVIFGGAANEGLMLTFFDKRLSYDIEKYTANFHQALPPELGIPFDSEKAKEYGEAVKKLYYGSAQPSAENWFPYSYVRFPGYLNYVTLIVCDCFFFRCSATFIFGTEFIALQFPALLLREWEGLSFIISTCFWV